MRIEFSITELDKLRDRYIKKYYRKLNASILKDLKPLIDQLELGLINRNFELDINVYNDVNELYIEVGSYFAKLTKRKFQEVLGKKLDDNLLYAQLMDDYFNEQVAELIVNVDDEIKRQIRAIIELKIAEGESVQVAAKSIIKQIKLISKKRALVIARTEIIKANNMGSFFAAESTGVDFDKYWITRFDSKTRDSHISANKQRVGKDEYFVVDGDRMLVPCDTSQGASAGNVINCRCTYGMIPKLPKIFGE